MKASVLPLTVTRYMLNLVLTAAAASPVQLARRLRNKISKKEQGSPHSALENVRNIVLCCQTLRLCVGERIDRACQDHFNFWQDDVKRMI
jgi:hypothetical protein